MNNKELVAVFDQQAATYDEQRSKTAPINQGLHFLLESVFAQLPDNARIICVRAGTGADLIHLAKRFPRWSFTAVEPARGMLQACKQRAEKEKIADRCVFFEGYVDALLTTDPYDAATCFLVSQFLMQRDDRVNFFRSIAQKNFFLKGYWQVQISHQRLDRPNTAHLFLSGQTCCQLPELRLKF